MHKNLLFKQLFDQTSGTYTYLLADKSTAEAVLIDTVYEQHKRDFALVQELALTLTACLETHCHADHVTGAWLLKHRTGCRILASAGSGIEPVEQALSEGDQISFGDFSLRVIPTPGHTDGCISLVMNDESIVFTGDALLIRSCGRTDFQQGSARKLYYSIKDQLFALPDDCLVYPAHDYAGRTVSSIGEEKQHNPRIGGQANEGDFVGYLENMQLPHPKQLDIAVPANLKAGRPDDNELPDTPDWAPVITNFSGIHEVAPEWVAANLERVHVLDVRTQRETEEENSGIAGAQFIPIEELRNRVGEVPNDWPIMTVCRSGKRSVLAFSILQAAGRDKVANISGGMLRWEAEGLPIKHTS